MHALSDALLDDNPQKALGLESISASQLSHKNNEINPSILENVFSDLVTQIQGFHVEKKAENQLKIIDSTTLPLNLTHYEWAKYRKTKARVKATSSTCIYG